MTCDCLKTIGEKLREQNLELADLAFVQLDENNWENWQTIPVQQLAWIDKAKAPKGKKNSPPKLTVSFCPFCGTSFKEPPSAPPVEIVDLSGGLA